jgi:hypothetical protein
VELGAGAGFLLQHHHAQSGERRGAGTGEAREARADNEQVHLDVGRPPLVAAGAREGAADEVESGEKKQEEECMGS